MDKKMEQIRELVKREILLSPENARSLVKEVDRLQKQLDELKPAEQIHYVHLVRDEQ
jgi:hypothetical protein